MQGLDYCERNDLEIARLMMQPHVKGDIKTKLKFPWDNETVKYEGRAEQLDKMKIFLENKFKNE